jgi:hypothetical protein
VALKILLYGSSYLTERCEKALLTRGHIIVGHVPCHSPSFPGQMRSAPVSEDEPHDIRLSILYDRLIKKIDNGYNVHPGLLPRWAGCDILYHTITEGARVQGITFHRLDKDFDSGPIIRRASYPVHPRDTIADLYKQLTYRMPRFVVQCIDMLEVDFARYYKRGAGIDRPDIYAQAGEDIRQFILEQRKEEETHELQSRRRP